MPSDRRIQLTDQQIITIAIAIIIPTAAVIYSNGRVSDMSKRIDDTNARINDLKDTLRADIKALGDRMETMLKIHVLEHHK